MFIIIFKNLELYVLYMFIAMIKYLLTVHFNAIYIYLVHYEVSR